MERAGERGLSIIIPRNSTREGKEGKSKKVRMRGDGRGRGRGGFSKAPRRRGPTTSPAPMDWPVEKGRRVPEYSQEGGTSCDKLLEGSA